MDMRHLLIRPIREEGGRPGLSIGRTVAVLALAFLVEIVVFAVVLLGGYCVALGGKAAWIGWGIIFWAMLGWVPSLALAQKSKRRRGRLPVQRPTTPPAGLWDHELDGLPTTAA
jgi:hypothetical protein